MIQYLKNMAGYSHAQLKNKSFDEVQKLFEKHMKWINRFVPMEEDLSSEKVQKEVSSEKKAEGSIRMKSIGKKRAKDKQEQESSKRQRVEDDKQEEELKKCFEISKEEEIEINVIPLATKVLVIGFQIHTRGKPGYYEIFRADRSLKLYQMFSQLLSDFDREDLIQKMNIKFRGGLLGLKGFLKLLLLSTAGTKVNAAGLQLLEGLLLLEG
ncbi:hypothetical protein Tco_0531433 [Tanacetum coccineum]